MQKCVSIRAETLAFLITVVFIRPWEKDMEQVVYFWSQSQQIHWGTNSVGKWNRVGKKSQEKGKVMNGLPLWGAEAQSFEGPSDYLEHASESSHWKSRKLGHLSIMSHPSLVEGQSRGIQSLALTLQLWRRLPWPVNTLREMQEIAYKKTMCK